MSPDSGRSLHGASQFQRAGLLPPTEHRGSFFLLPGVRRETVCLLKTRKSKLLCVVSIRVTWMFGVHMFTQLYLKYLQTKL